MRSLQPWRVGLVITLATAIACALPPQAEAVEPAKPPAAEATSPEHAAQMAAGLTLFKEQVRATLTNSCLMCHGGDETEGDLSLATRETLLAGGASGDTVIPGDPEASWLYQLITHAEEPAMPMEASKLSDGQIAAIKQWIELGAPYDRPLVDPERELVKWTERTIRPEDKAWWAYQPLSAAAPPEVASDWVKNDVDRFVFSALAEKNLTPNEAAPRIKQIRRLYLDLIGLPPTPEQIDAFLNDTDPKAYEKLVDELLASRHYGERWARHWLDVARFAESDGFEHDYDRPYAWHYRDFVIRALNSDMPFDQFLRWQLAGDEFAPDDPMAMKATGFLAAGVYPTQITAAEVERIRYDAMDDMLATTTSAMLGLTVGCARCHDHKFDPFPQADYYRMLATFTTTVRAEIDLPVSTPDDEEYRQFEEAHQQLVADLNRYEKEKLPQALAAWEVDRAQRPTWNTVELTSFKSQGGATLQKLDDGSVLASGKNPDFDTYTFEGHTTAGRISAIRLETLPHESFVRGGPGRASNGNFCLTDLQVVATPLAGDGEPVTVTFKAAKATYDRPRYESALAIDANKAGRGYALDPHLGQTHHAVYEAAEPFGFEGGTRLRFTMIFQCNTGHNIGRCRFSVTDSERPALEAVALPAEVAAVLETAPDKRQPGQTAALLAWYKMQDPGWVALNKRVAEHELLRPKPVTQKVQVATEGVPARRKHTQGVDFFEKTYFLKRGDSEQKDSVATQSFLQVLMPTPESASRWQVPPPAGSKVSYRRRAMASWITDTDGGAGHLAARVAVNRLWHHHFGRGIVATPSDFGTQGAPPTHPELLDWLASKLIENGWRLKPIHKLIVTSAAYRQSSAMDEADFRADPENTLLWRFEPRRVEAEIIRDAVLAVSGRLDRTPFGPGTLDVSMRRRSIYFTVKRSRLIPFMQLFDAPEAISSIGNRQSTTVATQALLFMNNPQVRDCAQGLAERMGADNAAATEAIERGYRITLGRKPTQQERDRAAAFVAAQQAAYEEAGQKHPEQLALADLAQALLSLNEFIYID